MQVVAVEALSLILAAKSRVPDFLTMLTQHRQALMEKYLAGKPIRRYCWLIKAAHTFF